jgi:hypothetical protein
MITRHWVIANITHGFRSREAPGKGQQLRRRKHLFGLRKESWLLPLVIMTLLPTGCVTTAERGEEVWVQIIPGRRYTFTDVSGEVQGTTLVIRGTMKAIGHYQREYTSVIVEGRDKQNKIQVQEREGVRIQSRRERFTFRVPYQPDLDWTVQSHEGPGLFSKIKGSL